MMKTLIAVAALSLIAPTAMAQTTSTQPSATAPSPGTMASPAGKRPQWYTHQSADIEASKLIGATVRNGANESIGDVDEVVLSKDGKVAAVVIGVGGFLGMGERKVAINFDSLELTTDDRGNTLVKLSVTKDALNAAPAWKSSEARPAAGAPGNTRPAEKPANPQ